MRICRFMLKSEHEAEPRLGLMEERGIRDVTSVTDTLPALRWPLPPGDVLIAHLAALAPQLARIANAAPLLPREAVRLLSPIANPGKFICGVGNWSHHKAPLGLLGFLFKATSALAGEAEGVQLRWPDRITLHEPELAIVIGRTCTNVSAAEALDYVAGYSCALDMTMKEDKEFYCFCKSFDTYGVLGPCLVTTDEIPDTRDLAMWLDVNGKRFQSSSTRMMIFKPEFLVAYVSQFMSLEPGDVISTGTPAGVGLAQKPPLYLEPGDVVTLGIAGLGEQRQVVVACD